MTQSVLWLARKIRGELRNVSSTGMTEGGNESAGLWADEGFTVQSSDRHSALWKHIQDKSRDRNDMIIDSFLKQVSGRSVGDNPTVSRLVIMLLAGLSGETDVYFANSGVTGDKIDMEYLCREGGEGCGGGIIGVGWKMIRVQYPVQINGSI